MNFTGIKITPLSIVLSVCVFYIGYLLLGFSQPAAGEVSLTVKALYTAILAIVLFFTDIVFRRFVLDMKWIWLIQTSFIVLIIIMILIFQKV